MSKKSRDIARTLSADAKWQLSSLLRRIRTQVFGVSETAMSDILLVPPDSILEVESRCGYASVSVVGDLLDAFSDVMGIHFDEYARRAATAGYICQSLRSEPELVPQSSHELLELINEEFLRLEEYLTGLADCILRVPEDGKLPDLVFNGKEPPREWP